jgi:hypothetical protein
MNMKERLHAVRVVLGVLEPVGDRLTHEDRMRAHEAGYAAALYGRDLRLEIDRLWHEDSEIERELRADFLIGLMDGWGVLMDRGLM